MNCRICNAPIRGKQKKYATAAKAMGLGEKFTLCQLHGLQEAYNDEPLIRQLIDGTNLKHLMGSAR